jgi:hypothetical protein
MPLAVDIDARFIGVCDLRLCQLIFTALFKLEQLLEGTAVKVVKRAFTQRYLQLVCEVLLNPFVGQ